MNLNKKLLQISNIFNDLFHFYFLKSDFETSDEVYKNFSSFYRKWLYSSKLEYTSLTPFNLIETFQFIREKNFNLICPMPQNINLENRTIKFKNLNYSINNHPVVDDIQIFVNSLPYVFDFNEDYTLKNLTISGLSIDDTFYRQYLLLLALEINLIKQELSIYTKKGTVNKNNHLFFKKNNKEKLNLIVKKSSNISSKMLNKYILENKNCITSGYILNILENPCLPKDILDKILNYSGLSLDILKLIDNVDFKIHLNNEKSLLNFKTYVYNIYLNLDRYFFTIFGYYLKIMNYTSFMPETLEKDINMALKTIMQGYNIENLCFYPVSGYCLTTLGDELFNCNKFEPKLNFDLKLIDLIIKNKFNIVKEQELKSIINFSTNNKIKSTNKKYIY